jgi:hypothetical protein
VYVQLRTVATIYGTVSVCLPAIIVHVKCSGEDETSSTSELSSYVIEYYTYWLGSVCAVRARVRSIAM